MKEAKGRHQWIMTRALAEGLRRARRRRKRDHSSGRLSTMVKKYFDSLGLKKDDQRKDKSDDKGETRKTNASLPSTTAT